ncbi:MAG TPA: tRNA (guanosine(37)-N1)-methyltransferase TrmD [Burkholderiales bacterium]|jgi:tRNA (guanine37-N1)-methyltransferase|nr:tRNA (guanosine(37)-N1)-methyltransferase TrmD [Burkholderiales bacterium]
MKRFDVITLFPEMFDALTRCGVTQRARDRGLYELVTWNPRDYAHGAYRSVDDRPYGGGPGMVMQAEPLAKAIRAARQRQASCGVRHGRTVYLSPQGRLLDQKFVEALGQYEGLVLMAGRYEGVDERVIEAEVDDEVSIGDYVVSGGELPAMVLIDAIVRRLPGALNDEASAQQDSFVAGLLDFPHYTRPEIFEGRRVPQVLLSGNHAQIRRWRLKQAIGRTWQRRPQLLAGLALDKEQQELLAEYRSEMAELEKSGA